MNTKLHAGAVQHLEILANTVSNLEPIANLAVDIDTSLLQPNTEPETELFEQIDQVLVPTGNCIYRFEISGDRPESGKITAAYLSAKANTDRAYSRLNDASTTLYVGSSRSIIKRLREHLGYGNHKTYAMHLAYWAPALNLKLKLHLANYPLAANFEAIQAVEDHVWRTYRPMLGRQGKR